MMLGNCPAGSAMWFGGDLWWVSALLIGLAVALVVTLVVLVGRSRPTTDPAIERLRLRLASGEISQADFETARRALGA